MTASEDWFDEEGEEAAGAGEAPPRLHPVNLDPPAPIRLDRALAEALPEFSRARLKALILEGHLKNAQGQPLLHYGRQIKGPLELVLEVPPEAPARPLPQPMALDIRHEDAQLLVVDKPAGLVVHPGPGNPDGTLVNGLIAHCGADFTGIGGVRRPGLVHRIDKDTSGLLVVAKTEPAYRDLVAQFSARSVARRYLAFAWGRPSPPEGRYDGPIGRDPRHRKRMAVTAKGRPAATRYKLLESYLEGLASLVSLTLETGRTHQIRVHLSHAGLPLIGDPLYGRGPGKRLAGLAPERRARLEEALAGLPGQALHAAQLGFRHPESGAWLEFESVLPLQLQSLKISLE